MLGKISAWILFLGTLIVNLGLTWWFWLGYNLLTPHSGIVYTGWAYWSWKFLLVQAGLAGLVFGFHLFWAGKALVQGEITVARKITIISLLILALQLTLSRLW